MVKRQDHHNICHLLLPFSFCFVHIRGDGWRVGVYWLVERRVTTSKGYSIEDRQQACKRKKWCCAFARAWTLSFYLHIISTFLLPLCILFSRSLNDGQERLRWSQHEAWVRHVVSLLQFICACLSMKSIRWTEHIFTWKQCTITNANGNALAVVGFWLSPPPPWISLNASVFQCSRSC